jgi:hypothetical protein
MRLMRPYPHSRGPEGCAACLLPLHTYNMITTTILGECWLQRLQPHLVLPNTLWEINCSSIAIVAWQLLLTPSRPWPTYPYTLQQP